MKTLITITLLFLAAHCYGSHLIVREKKKDADEQTVRGKVVSFKDGVLVFRSHARSRIEKTEAMLTDSPRASRSRSMDASYPATKYAMVVLVEQEVSSPGSIHDDEEKVTTKNSRRSHGGAEAAASGSEGAGSGGKGAAVGALSGEVILDRHAASCHKRGTDWLEIKGQSGRTFGTIDEIDTAGSSGYVFFKKRGEKAPLRFRFEDLETIGIGICK